MTKPTRSHFDRQDNSGAPTVLSTDDLVAVDGGTHFAGCTVPVVVKPLCPPPPPRC